MSERDDPDPQHASAARLAALESGLHELRERLARVERAAGLAAEAAPAPPATPPPEFILPELEQQPSQPPPIAPAVRRQAPPTTEVSRVRPRRQRAERRSRTDLEETIAGQWFNYIGALALLIAAALLLKLGYDLGWFGAGGILGPTAICGLGWAIGIAVLIAGERTRHRTPLYGQVLTGLAAALLYATTYAGKVYAGLLSDAASTALLMVVSLLTVALALRHDSVQIAALGALMGYVNPLLIGGGGAGGGGPASLFVYLIALSLVVLAVSVPKQWSGFRLAAFAGTWIVFLGWYAQTPSVAAANRPLIVLFLSAVFAIFLAVSVANPLVFRRDAAESDVPLAVFNPLSFYGFVYYVARDDGARWLGGLAIGLAIGYWVLAQALGRRLPASKLLAHLLNGIGHLLAIVAIPVLLHGRWLTIAWAMQAAMLLLVGWRAESVRVRRWASTPLALAVLRLVLVEAWEPPTSGVVSAFDERGAAFAATLAGIAAAIVVLLWERRAPDADGRSATGKDAFILPLALLFGALGDLWIGLVAPLAWRFPLWALLAGLIVAAGWQQRCGGLRNAGYVLAFWAAAAVSVVGLGAGWTGDGPLLLGPLLLTSLVFIGLSAFTLRQESGSAEWALQVPMLALTVALLLIAAHLGLSPLWLPVAACLLALGVLAVGLLTGAAPARWLAFALTLVPILVLVFLEGSTWTPPSVRELAPGFVATIVALVVFTVLVVRRPDRDDADAAMEGFGPIAALCLAAWWAYLGLSAGGAVLATVGAAAAALFGGETLRSDRVRGIGAFAMLVASVWGVFVAITLPAGHALLLHDRSLALAATIGGCLLARWRLRAAPLELPGWEAIPLVETWVAAFLGLCWISAEAMDLAAATSATGSTLSSAGFGLSAAWAIYAGAAIALGFVRRSRGARLAGLALLTITIVKVFTVDVAALENVYRILSFATLGLILLGVAYAYQRFTEQLKSLLQMGEGRGA